METIRDSNGKIRPRLPHDGKSYDDRQIAEKFKKPGWWPQGCVQRAFVEGARWQMFEEHGRTPWADERAAMEAEAIARYGEPNPEDQKERA